MLFGIICFLFFMVYALLLFFKCFTIIAYACLYFVLLCLFYSFMYLCSDLFCCFSVLFLICFIFIYNVYASCWLFIMYVVYIVYYVFMCSIMFVLLCCVSVSFVILWAFWFLIGLTLARIYRLLVPMLALWFWHADTMLENFCSKAGTARASIFASSFGIFWGDFGNQDGAMLANLWRKK